MSRNDDLKYSQRHSKGSSLRAKEKGANFCYCCELPADQCLCDASCVPSADPDALIERIVAKWTHSYYVRCPYGVDDAIRAALREYEEERGKS